MFLNRIVRRTVDPRPLAIARIGIGVAAILLALVKRDDIRLLADPEVLRIPVAGWLPEPTVAFADVLAVVWILAAAALTVGLKARAAAVGVAIAGAAAMSVDQQLYSNHLTLMITLALLLALGRPGAAWSLDARRHGREPEVPYWPQFLLQTQISVVYAFAALSKVNESFLSGDVLETYLRDEVVEAIGSTGLGAAARLAVLTELFLAGALWIPRLRPPAFVLGLGLHAGIVLAMPDPEQLVPFGLMMISGYLLFPEWSPGSRIVVWDDNCSFCRAWVNLFRRLDWLGVHRLQGSSDEAAYAATGITREQADRALQLVGPGERAEGFDAVRAVLEKCPATFLLAPILRLWPITVLGRRAYRRVAARRTCRLPEIQAPDSAG